MSGGTDLSRLQSVRLTHKNDTFVFYSVNKFLRTINLYASSFHKLYYAHLQNQILTHKIIMK